MDYNDSTAPTMAVPGAQSSGGPRKAGGSSAPLWGVSLAAGPRWSADRGVTWTATPGANDYTLSAGQSWKTVKALGLNALGGAREVLAGSATGVRVLSRDGGETWRRVDGTGSGLEGSSKNFSSLLSTSTAFGTTDILLGVSGTTTGGVFLSGDGGEHWVQVNQGCDPTQLSISALVKTSCAGCPVQYYSGSFGGGVCTRSFPRSTTPAGVRRPAPARPTRGAGR